MIFDKTLAHQKTELLAYFRDRATEAATEISQIQGTNNPEKSAAAINKAIIKAQNIVVKVLEQEAHKYDWTNLERLNCMLMVTYTSYVAMIEARNEAWLYDYMSFSRRIGELWEPFCKLCFEYPITDISLFVPPLFSQVRQSLQTEIYNYITQLPISAEQKIELENYYKKVWQLVASGEVKLELDLHFRLNEQKIVVDFKSGFGSNEKGNTNRLLLVATVYQQLLEGYQCLLLVRSPQESTNHYFQTLKKSGLWQAYCGNEAYNKIKEYSGFDLHKWIADNVNWLEDLNAKTLGHFSERKLEQYLKW